MSVNTESPDAPAPKAESSSPAASAPAAVAAPEAAKAGKTRKGGAGFGVAVIAFIFGLIGGIAGALVFTFAPLPLKTAGKSEAVALEKTLAQLPILTARVAALEQRASAPSQASKDTDARLQTLQQQITALQMQAPSGAANPLLTGLAASVTELKGRVDSLGSEAQAVSNLTARISALETRVPADLSAQLTALAAKAEVASLDLRLGKLEANTSAYDAKRAAAAVALANLARAAASGAPFVAELDAVRAVKTDPALITPLSTYAARGVPSPAQLAADFPTVARNAVRASRQDSKNLWDRMAGSMSGLFVVRREGVRAGDNAEAVLARAEIAAKSGNLRAAAAELAALRGAAADAAEPWRKKAEARVALDGLLTKLSGQILADVQG